MKLPRKKKKLRKQTLICYDLAYLPKRKIIREILIDANKHGIIVYDSSAAGNYSGRNLDNQFKPYLLSTRYTHKKPYSFIIKDIAKINA